jgi:hypothetical protein
MPPRVDLRRLNHSDSCILRCGPLFRPGSEVCTKDRKDREVGQAFVQGNRYTTPRDHPARDFRCNGSFPLVPPVRSDWRRGELRSGEACIGRRRFWLAAYWGHLTKLKGNFSTLRPKITADLAMTAADCCDFGGI